MIEHAKNGYICKCVCGRVIGPFGTIRELVEALIDKGWSITYNTSEFLLNETLNDEDLQNIDTILCTSCMCRFFVM